MTPLQHSILEYLVKEAPNGQATKRMVGTAMFGDKEFVADKVWPDLKALEERGLVTRVHVLGSPIYRATDIGYELLIGA